MAEDQQVAKKQRVPTLKEALRELKEVELNSILGCQNDAERKNTVAKVLSSLVVDKEDILAEWSSFVKEKTVGVDT